MTNHKPTTALPLITLNAHGDISGESLWPPAISRLSLDEKREVVRRANVYPRLVDFITSTQYGDKHWPEADILLRKLEES